MKKLKITNQTKKVLKKGDVEVIKAKSGETHTDKFHKSCYLVYLPDFIREVILK